MRRRNILGLAAGLALILGQAVPYAASDRVRRVTVLLPVAKDDPNFAENERVLRRALLKSGWVEGKNLALTFASVGSDPDAIGRLLPGILTPEPDVIISRSTAVALALHRRAQRTPVVFTQVSDPVGQGLVATMQRPGDNMTGFTVMEPSMGGKWVGLLREIVPDLKRVAFLQHRASSPISTALADSIAQIGPSLGLETLIVPLQARADLEPAFARLAALDRVGLLVSPGAFTLENRVLITSLAARGRIPALYPFRYFVTAGGLASYGTDETVWFQLAGDYVDRILRGARPGDLPIQGPNRLSFVLNAKAADELGLTVTPTLLARADEIID
ncbi:MULTISPECIES: ABC transporter substrate-binding protein [unclassified Methylobacterium]|jgi:putative ABC transport system substrate-binding protein|uniref:ABC transporter substrate-binding protein n=1 Tax=unclassified Methylobacterium TaxID=2615210 RepID=UPI001353F03F|nr:ABC transporter substrate-binding protein [Methylobacterium sp. 2A]MWV22985.1 ABC transporter substrate-binding protein [Methylobacterium sp. 2A]